MADFMSETEGAGSRQRKSSNGRDPESDWERTCGRGTGLAGWQAREWGESAGRAEEAEAGAV